MVTSRPCFSKKPRSRAIGSPIWSMPVTMPALSLTGSCASAGAATSKPAARRSVRLSILSSRWQRLDAPDPIGSGQRGEVRLSHTPHFDGVVLRSRDATIALEHQHMEPFRHEGQSHEHIYARCTGREAGRDLARRGERQPQLVGENPGENGEDRDPPPRGQGGADQLHAERTIWSTRAESALKSP